MKKIRKKAAWILALMLFVSLSAGLTLKAAYGDTYSVEPVSGKEDLDYAGATGTLFTVNGTYNGFCVDRDRGHYSAAATYTETATVITDPASKLYQTFYYGYGGPGYGEAYSFANETEAIVATNQAASHFYAGTASGMSYTAAITNLSADKIPPAHTMGLSAASLTAAVSGNVQKTDWVTLNLDSRLSADVTIPEGVTLWIEGETGGHTGTATIQGGKRFYLTAPLNADGIKQVTLKYTGNRMLRIVILDPPAAAYQPVAFYTNVNPSVTLSAAFSGKGDIEIIKSSSDPSVTGSNSCYSLAGAVYGVYKYASDAVSDVNRVTSITTDVNGYGKATDLEVRTYYVKEITAPKGYALDTTVHTVTVNAGATGTLNLTDVPQMDPVFIMVEKQGSSGKMLEGAEFTFKFYEGVQTDTDPALTGKIPDRTWVLKTNSQGVAVLDSSSKVSGDEFYYDLLSGYPALPLGTITVKETKAPEGYCIDTTVYVRKITSEGTSAAVSTYNAPVVVDEVKKQPFEIYKLGETKSGNVPLAGAGFKACNVKDLTKDAEGNYIWDESKAVVLTTSGEKELITDESGYALSSALEYGTYLVRETTVPEGYHGVEDFIVNITENSKTAKTFTLVDESDGFIENTQKVLTMPIRLWYHKSKH